MKNITGQPARGDSFYRRNDIIQKICRRLNSGENLYLRAPRRSGKTSIMYFLQENPCPGYAFVYLNTEPDENPELFFKRTLEVVLQHPIVQSSLSKSSKSWKTVQKTLDRVKALDITFFKIELNQRQEDKYSDAFSELLQGLDPKELKLVLMIDEFPSTVENINQNPEFGSQKAVQFLHENRRIRQTSNQAIQFIYTGSIGLPALVSRLGAPASVNDLVAVDVLPFSQAEGTELAQKLLASYDVQYDEEILAYLLDRVEWLMPFFIQLVVQELIDLFDKNKRPLTNADVDEALKLISTRRENHHFESYYLRIKTNFKPDEAALAHKILRQIAHDTTVPADKLSGLVSKEQQDLLRYVLDGLDFDGYVHLVDGVYRFNSPILQTWWKQYTYA